MHWVWIFAGLAAAGVVTSTAFSTLLLSRWRGRRGLTGKQVWLFSAFVVVVFAFVGVLSWHLSHHWLPVMFNAFLLSFVFTGSGGFSVPLVWCKRWRKRHGKPVDGFWESVSDHYNRYSQRCLDEYAGQLRRLRETPTELVSSPAPAGRGTEVVASAAPAPPDAAPPALAPEARPDDERRPPPAERGPAGGPT